MLGKVCAFSYNLCSVPFTIFIKFYASADFLNKVILAQRTPDLFQGRANVTKRVSYKLD